MVGGQGSLFAFTFSHKTSTSYSSAVLNNEIFLKLTTLFCPSGQYCPQTQYCIDSEGWKSALGLTQVRWMCTSVSSSKVRTCEAIGYSGHLNPLLSTAGVHEVDSAPFPLHPSSKSSFLPTLSSRESWMNKRLLSSEFSTKIHQILCAFLCRTGAVKLAVS